MAEHTVLAGALAALQSGRSHNRQSAEWRNSAVAHRNHPVCTCCLWVLFCLQCAQGVMTLPLHHSGGQHQLERLLAAAGGPAGCVAAHHGAQQCWPGTRGEAAPTRRAFKEMTKRSSNRNNVVGAQLIEALSSAGLLPMVKPFWHLPKNARRRKTGISGS